jgi:hypothetical protein
LEENNNKKQLEAVEYINDFPSEDEEQLRLAKENQAEANFQSAQAHQKKIARRKKFLKTAALGIAFVILIGGVIFVIFSSVINKKSNNSAPVGKTVNIPLPENKDHVFANDVSGVIDENASTEIDDSKGLIGKSENYKIKDISIGGGTVVLAAETDILPITVFDVKTETLFSRDQKETKLLISWKTNKLARSDVKYAKTGSDQKVLKENSFGFSHALVLGKLDQATRYSFVVEVTDRAGNTAKSDEFVAYTGTKAVSVFELISSELDNMFGWAIKK